MFRKIVLLMIIQIMYVTVISGCSGGKMGDMSSLTVPAVTTPEVTAPTTSIAPVPASKTGLGSFVKGQRAVSKNGFVVEGYFGKASSQNTANKMNVEGGIQ